MIISFKNELFFAWKNVEKMICGPFERNGNHNFFSPKEIFYRIRWSDSPLNLHSFSPQNIENYGHFFKYCESRIFRLEKVILKKFQKFNSLIWAHLEKNLKSLWKGFFRSLTLTSRELVSHSLSRNWTKNQKILSSWDCYAFGK